MLIQLQLVQVEPPFDEGWYLTLNLFQPQYQALELDVEVSHRLVLLSSTALEEVDTFVISMSMNLALTHSKKYDMPCGAASMSTSSSSA